MQTLLYTQLASGYRMLPIVILIKNVPFFFKTLVFDIGRCLKFL